MILIWRPAAEQDLNNIVEFIALDNPYAAVDQGDKIDQQIAELLNHPSLGRTGRVKGTRELVIVGTQYIAAYRVKQKEIQVLRILHAARAWPKSL